MITILSYCDTQQKKDQLLNLITGLKTKFPEKEILVYSHYQNLEPKYYKGANYYIFDFTNPISSKSFSDWIYVYHQSKKFYRSGLDFGFAVIQMIKRSCLFLLSMDIKETIILNYDCSVDDLDNINLIKVNDDSIGAFSFWGPNNENNPSPPINLTFMYLKISDMGKEFFESMTYEKYMSYDTSIIPEAIFGKILNEKFKDRWSLIRNKISPTISGASRQIPNDHYLNKYFSTILPTRNNFLGNKHKCLAIWTCKDRINQIDIDINENKYTLYNEIEGDYSNMSFFSHLPGGITIEEITLLSINSVEIEPYTIGGLSEHYWKSNHHEPCFDKVV
jgi:hypothetical protein